MPPVEALWARHFAGERLTEGENRRLRLSGPHLTPGSLRGFTMGPGVTNEQAARMPCYCCGSRVRADVDPIQTKFLLFADHTVLPEGAYRLCKRCWTGHHGSFDGLTQVHLRRYESRHAHPEWQSLEYYHPRAARERL